jgi:hypothetical protein
LVVSSGEGCHLTPPRDERKTSEKTKTRVRARFRAKPAKRHLIRRKGW